MKSPYNNQYGDIKRNFGNWYITDQGILWFKGIISDAYFIEKERIFDILPTGGTKLWQWPLSLTEKDWLTEKDLEDFNEAFFFAIDFFEKEKPANTEEVDKKVTLEYQRKYFKGV